MRKERTIEPAAIPVPRTDWLRTVCNPAKYALEQSLDLAQRARTLDPLTELKLAKMLAQLKFANEEETRFAMRVLEVLERSPDPAAALPALRQLSQCPDAHVRSKAVLLIGRIVRSPRWAAKSTSESDPRVSANSVESLWGADSSAAREVFSRAARDKYHRTAANGIVGLYLMADSSSISFLFHLSRSEKASARAAAAWAMGRVEDPRFLGTLERMTEDSDPATRKNAVHSMARVRRRMTRLSAAGAMLVRLREVECHGSDHRIRFVVTREQQLVKGLDARQFVVWNGPDLVEKFSLSFCEGADPYYEISYQSFHQGSPSSMHSVKVQVYAAQGAGE